MAIIGISEDGKEHTLYKVDKEIDDKKGGQWRAYPLANVAFALMTFRLEFRDGSNLPHIGGIRVTGLETHPPINTHPPIDTHTPYN